MHLELGRETNKELAADGNMQNLKLLSTFQKAKSEQNCKYDLRLKSNHIGDLMQQCCNDRKTSDPYLQRVGIPVFAMMYSKNQLHLIESKKLWVLHLDATGSVVREPDSEDCKRILYYALVARFLNSTIPLAELISSEHDTTAISHFLKDYRKFVVQDGYKWPTFSIVVVDWSWVLIHGLLFEWNHIEIQTYLKIAYDCAKKNIAFPKDMVIIHTFCSYYMHRAADNLDRKFPEYPGCNLVLDCIAFMIMCQTLTELDAAFESTISILLSPDESVADEKLEKLNSFHKEGFAEVIANNSNIDIELTFDDDDDKDGIAINSPFFFHFYEIFQKVESSTRSLNDDEDPTNKCYSPEVAKLILNHFMPFIIMAAAILFKNVLPEASRLSNAYVEAHFKTVKDAVLRNQRHLPIARFIRKLKKYTSELAHEEKQKVLLKSRKEMKPLYPQNRKKNEKKIEENETADSESDEIEMIPIPLDPSLEESWEKNKRGRKRKAQSHLECHSFKKSTQSQESKVDKKKRKASRKKK